MSDTAPAVAAWAARHAATAGPGAAPPAGWRGTADLTVVPIATPAARASDVKAVWGVAIGELRDGRAVVAVSNHGGRIEVRDLRSGASVAVLRSDGQGAAGLAFVDSGSPDIRLLSSDHAGDILEWDPISGAFAQMASADDSCRRIATYPRPDGSVAVLSGSFGGDCTFWDRYPLDTTPEMFAFAESGIKAVAIAAEPDGSLALAAVGDNGVAVCQRRHYGELLALPTVDSEDFYSVAFAMVDRELVVVYGGEKGVVSVVGAADRQMRYQRSMMGVVTEVATCTLPDGTPLFAVATMSPPGKATLWDLTDGRCLATLEHPAAIQAVDLACCSGRTYLVTGCNDGVVRVWELVYDPPDPPASDSPEPGFLMGMHASDVAGVVALDGAGIHQPLGLLTDVIAVTGGEPPLNRGLAALSELGAVRDLRALHWSRTARVGMAALLLADLPPRGGFVAPKAEPWLLHAALSAALAPGATPPHPVTVPLASLVANVAALTDRMVTLLALLGESAVAADPLLPLRMRHLADEDLLILDQGRLRLLRELTGAMQRRNSPQKGASVGAPGFNGVARRGRLTGVLPTQLALPHDEFDRRYARGDLLYRQHDGEISPPMDPVTIVLDTTPPTFGPVEVVLRAVAHVLVTALLEAGRSATLVRLDRPDVVVPIDSPADRLALWAGRTLDPPDLAVALETAARLPEAVTVVLAERHLLDRPPAAVSELRLLTTHTPNDPPRGRSLHAFHVHIPPEAEAGLLAAAVSRLLDVASPAR